MDKQPTPKVTVADQQEWLIKAINDLLEAQTAYPGGLYAPAVVRAALTLIYNVAEQTPENAKSVLDDMTIVAQQIIGNCIPEEPKSRIILPN